jgi:glycosyltransferase involved in cell wall biosynthesis
MKLLYVTDAFAVYGGIERVLAEKMNYLSDHLGYEVVLLTVNQGEHTPSFPLHPLIKHVDLNVRMHRQYGFRGLKRYSIHRQLVAQLKDKLKQALLQINADVIVCAKLDFIGVLNEVGSSAPLVVELHSLCKADHYEGVGLLRRLHVWGYKRQVKHADAVVALTSGDAEDWRAYNKNVFVIPNVVLLNETSNYSSCTEKRIVFVGRYTKQKDFDSLLRIWAIVFSRHSDWTLDVYTDGRVEAPGVRDFKPVANIKEKYNDSSILLLTSLFEPFGLVLPEAMSCGLPVVSFDCPYGPADIITDGVDGFLIKNRDILAFADRVCQLIEDKELRLRMGQAAIKSAQRYRADVIMPKWKELFEHLCRKE